MEHERIVLLLPKHCEQILQALLIKKNDIAAGIERYRNISHIASERAFGNVPVLAVIGRPQVYLCLYPELFDRFETLIGDDLIRRIIRVELTRSERDALLYPLPRSGLPSADVSYICHAVNIEITRQRIRHLKGCHLGLLIPCGRIAIVFRTCLEIIDLGGFRIRDILPRAVHILIFRNIHGKRRGNALELQLHGLRNAQFFGPLRVLRKARVGIVQVIQLRFRVNIPDSVLSSAAAGAENYQRGRDHH